MAKPHYFTNEASRIRALFKAGKVSISLSSHAREEMADDGLYLEDVICVLKSCRVIEVDGLLNETRYKAQGRTVDGMVVNVVLKMREVERNIYVITVFAVR